MLCRCGHPRLCGLQSSGQTPAATDISSAGQRAAQDQQPKLQVRRRTGDRTVVSQYNPSPLRDPRKLPKLISGSGSGTETKYRAETLTEEEETTPENNEEAAGEQEENEEEVDADDEAELTDVRTDKDQSSEIKPQETTEEEVKDDLVSTKGIL